MGVWKLVKLKFGRSVAHFGELGIGIEETSERVRSDTLFSAWITAYARLHGGDAVKELLELFPSDVERNGRSHLTPPFRLSSTFLYREVNNKTIYYLPRPLQFPPNYPIEDDLDFAKTYKGLKYLPLEVWQRWYQQSGFDLDQDGKELTARTQKAKSEINNLQNAGTFDYKKAFETHKIPKVAIDRITRASNIYHIGCVQYQWEQNGQGIKSLSGLYFLLHLVDGTLEDKLRAALTLLGEEGLGGERSSGAGRFEMTWDDLPDDKWQSLVNSNIGSNTSPCQSLLSLFWDNTIQPDFLHHASYELHQRGGWVGSTGHQRRRQVVSMFGEGSVFTGTVPLAGKLADVTPKGFDTQQQGHNIYRSGIALSLPIQVLQSS